MNINESISKRILEICDEKEKSVCEICMAAGLTPSTVYGILYGESKRPQVLTVKRFCEGAGITMSEFFDRPYFNELEEI